MEEEEDGEQVSMPRVREEEKEELEIKNEGRNGSRRDTRKIGIS